MHRWLLALSLALYTLAAGAEQAPRSDSERRFTLENTRYHTFNSPQTGHQHEVIVTLPPGYQDSPNRRYPVLYYLDAYWDTPLLSAIYGNLDYDNVIPHFIMVGLSYPEGANYDQERWRDLTPTNLQGNAGGAKKLLQFIQQNLVPFVEKQYRVDPSTRALAGVSLGGLFTLYAMYENSQYFDRYIAISPAAEWDGGYIARLDRQYAKHNRALPARLFLSYGSAEYAPFRDPIIKFQQQLAKNAYQGLALQNYAMEGLRHTGVKADGYTRGLMWIWKDLAPTGPSGLERAYRAPNPGAAEQEQKAEREQANPAANSDD